MPTKAQLEQELADLKREMDELRSAKDTATPDASESSEEATQHQLALPEDWTAVLEEIETEIENLPAKKALILAAGAFALGLLVGRRR